MIQISLHNKVIFNKAMRTTINFYLVNLTVADLMVTAWGPFHRWTIFLNFQQQFFVGIFFSHVDNIRNFQLHF